MRVRRPTFKQAAIGSAIFLAIWCGRLVVVAVAIISIARVPWPVAREFFSTRRAVFAVMVAPVGLTLILWIQAVVGWLQSAIERRLSADTTPTRR
jgi:hypothetical protein